MDVERVSVGEGGDGRYAQTAALPDAVSIKVPVQRLELPTGKVRCQSAQAPAPGGGPRRRTPPRQRQRRLLTDASAGGLTWGALLPDS